jgi:hypothetical protein
MAAYREGVVHFCDGSMAAFGPAEVRARSERSAGSHAVYGTAVRARPTSAETGSRATMCAGSKEAGVDERAG